MAVYYNEKDPFAAAWLRNLSAANMIAPGDVDERDIQDVVPLELYKYTQCHFFAGIGVWSYAMRRAGWPDDRHAWSGSCPCQPFSAAGKGAGFTDERHLWPAFYHLIEQCGPDVIFGEQVASPDGLAWLDLVQSDLETASYAVGTLDTCAAGYGAPHVRQRLYWMAYATEPRRFPWGRPSDTSGGAGTAWFELGRFRDVGGLANPFDGQLSEEGRKSFGRTWQPGTSQEFTRPGPVNGAWNAVDWLRCRDERWRPVEPGTSPLVNGAPNRVGLLRGYGNAIVAPQAEEFIRAAMGYAP